MANYVLDITRIPEAATTNPDGDTGSVSAFRFVAQGSADTGVDTTPTLNGPVIGVTMDELDPDKVTAGGSVAVRVMGIAPVRAGTGGTTAGTRVSAGADGKTVAVGTAATNFSVGIALQSGSVGSIVDVLLTPGVLAV
jgi:hypothetical protein